MVGLVYTANFGGYETLKAVEPEDGVVYWMFSDQKSSPGWSELRYSVNDPLRSAREVKVNAPSMYPTFDWFLWIDGSFLIKKPILPLVEKLLDSEHDFAAFKHPEWQCAYTEAVECEERNKDTDINLARAIMMMDKCGFPRNFGQLASGVLFRKNTELVKEHALGWWEDMKCSTMRDQCTFMVNLWSRDAYIEWIPGSYRENKWFKYRQGHP